MELFIGNFSQNNVNKLGQLNVIAEPFGSLSKH